jgi:hypothetical protein
MAANRPAVRFLLVASAFLGAMFLYMHFALHLLLALIVLRVLLWALGPLARKHGWGSEGRLMRYFSRPSLIDQSKRLCVDSDARW